MATAKTATLKVEYRDPAKLVPYARNSRTHTEDQIKKIAASIRKFGWTKPIIVRGDQIAAGHGAWRAAIDVLKLDRVPVIDRAEMSEADYRAYVIADNRLAELSGWDNALLKLELGELKALDFDLTLIGFDLTDFDRLLGAAGHAPEDARETLAERFGVPPFSILDTRQGYWQLRKRAWLSLGIKSEVGRGANLLQFSDTVLSGGKKRGLTPELGGRVDNPEAVIPNFYKQMKKPGATRESVIAAWQAKQPKGRKAAQAIQTQDWVKAKKGEDYSGLGAGFDGTSIFDPVLCELAYRWFAPQGGLVLDPFAGGSVRGIVSGYLGRPYVGIDLRPEQVAANQAQAKAIKPVASPTWFEGDSLDLAKILKLNKIPKADFVFSCPPYGDLERYSDDARDLSTFDLETFARAYAEIIKLSVAQLKDDRFACFVVGDYRAPDGLYRDFIGQTVAAFHAAGARLYNEAILVSAIGSLPIRAAKQFSASRKLGKCHQNVLVFVKGDAKRATKACGKVDVAVPIEGEQTEFGERLDAASLGGSA